jgi:hypothetical protein
MSEIYEVSHDTLLQLGNQIVSTALNVTETRLDLDREAGRLSARIDRLAQQPRRSRKGQRRQDRRQLLYPVSGWYRNPDRPAADTTEPSAVAW